MGYYVKVLLGVGLILGGLAAVIVSIVELVDIGTCASGGPYQVVQECPEGIERWMGLIFGGVIAFIIGIAVFAARGGRAIDPGLPSAEARQTPDWSNLSGAMRKNPQGTPSTSTVFTNRAAANAAASAASAIPVAVAEQAGDPVERLEQLNQLREKGAISEAEFAEAKTRILRDL